MKTLNLLLALFLAAPALAQEPKPAEPPIEGEGPVATFKVEVVARNAKAINYRHREGSTTIDFKDTQLMPKARGEAKVESKKGYIEIEVEFDDVQSASSFGPEYLTYVMWAITPEGRASNLGEVLLDHHGWGKLNVTTELQAFGLIITAEPYFAVTIPSDLVVMENAVRSTTMGKVEEINARYELLQRGGYLDKAERTELKPITFSSAVPLELYEARNAVQIARWNEAERYAGESFRRAEKLLAQAEDYQKRKAGKRPVIMTAREAVQTAEDARAIAVRRAEEERLAAQLEAERSARGKVEADAARLAALQQEEAARRAAEEAERRRLQAEAEKEELRRKLFEQFNRILETHDTPRGLVVNLPDVLFDVNQFALKPVAREKLARFAGIVLAYPGLKLEIEGHTDSTGEEDYNLKLSQRRGDSVQKYLEDQGVAPEMMGVLALGEADPIADNKTAKGRKLNRRVEIVVSGEVIGNKVGGSNQM